MKTLYEDAGPVNPLTGINLDLLFGTFPVLTAQPHIDITPEIQSDPIAFKFASAANQPILDASSIGLVGLIELFEAAHPPTH